MNWRAWLDKFDEMFASFARPYQIYICSTSVAVSLPLAVSMRAGDITISALAATAGGIAGYTGYLRTAEKKIAANAASTTVSATTAGGATVAVTAPAGP
jgi:hypothetical protein